MGGGWSIQQGPMSLPPLVGPFAGAGSRLPGAHRELGRGLRGSAGCRPPGGGSVRWRLPAGAAARRRMPAAVEEAAVSVRRRNVVRGAVRSQGAGLPGCEPGSGYSSLAPDGVEGDVLPGGVQARQRGDGALAGLLGPAAGGRDDVVGVVSPHRRPRLPGPFRSRRSSCPGW